MSSYDLFAVILAGGSGTRFWPASRRDLPKQFLAIAGAEPMIAATWERVRGLVPPERILVVSARSQAEAVRSALPALPAENLLAEPVARNTAPAIAWATAVIARRSPKAVQVVLPSDHVIRPAEDFQRTLRAAAEEAHHSGALVTLGIRPTFAATGFGWIESGAELGRREGHSVLSVARFVEKPSQALAETFLASGRHLWNSGMFVWRNDVITAELEARLPAVQRALESWRGGEPLSNLYPTLPSISIDYAVLEGARGVRVLPIDYAWNDVGSWDALRDVNRPDAAGNVHTGGAELVALESTGCVVHAPGGELVALIGVHDLVVVHAGGATLVCPRARAQEVKRIVETLADQRSEFL